MADWDKTELIERRLEAEGKLQFIDGVPHYKGRPIIHRDFPVDGGVYLGEEEREAIVIDSSKYPGIRRLCNIAKQKATSNGRVRKHRVLRAVFDTVLETMPNQSEDSVDRLIFNLNVDNDRKIALDVFLETEMGVCRHDAVTCAALLERFRKKGHIKGHASVDRNYDEEFGSHSWCRYTNSVGKVFILDVALGNIARIEDVVGSLREGKWPYQRPDEIINKDDTFYPYPSNQLH